MKTNILKIMLIALMISSCTTPKYLPSSDNIAVNEFGSYIKIIRIADKNIRGELIAIDSNNIFVLEIKTKNCMSVPLREVDYFSLKYAKPKDYSWTIPVYTFGSFLIHGLLGLYIAPVNLVVTIILNVSGENAFKYSDKNMSYDKLKMFARFPQGVPSNVDLESIE